MPTIEELKDAVVAAKSIITTKRAAIELRQREIALLQTELYVAEKNYEEALTVLLK